MTSPRVSGTVQHTRSAESNTVPPPLNERKHAKLSRRMTLDPEEQVTKLVWRDWHELQAAADGEQCHF